MLTHATARTVLDSVRSTAPLVSCITNSVVTNFTANALLAIGAAPAMVDIVGEAGPFASVASGLLINLGTPTPEQREAAVEAAGAANAAGTPWVLDPVGVGSLVHRTELAHRLVDMGPAAIRGNASEIIALAGDGSGGRGVDAADEVDAALGSARLLAARTGGVVAVSGAADAVVSADETIRVAGGSEMLTRVTGGGCSLGAMIACFLAAGRSAGVGDADSVAACHVAYSAAAEIAAEGAAGPGSFAPRFLDALYGLAGSDLERIRLS
ncbi:hydroxyethylthiazole kinase [Actinomyces sp. B33]|uniref:hydroxyethylthiazole kinase n=1 Tax=Actinomyces sp. B33 TaxID=2942131 RepID=UPI00234152DB|nr:hydroxyethylthiazole kinase [Actinomyces sp. B33]MDC4232337.1 hydroxyethylthiazole kinase [Actinomyces sp. B33]